MIDDRIPRPHDKPVKELRLALVCYGGVSLAIYMHGITKEIHKLVRASEAFYADPTKEPEDAAERTYWKVLQLCAERDSASTRVVVDVIAGTSAGGINGICLAKALAGNRSQDALRTLWIEKGDIGLLMRGPGWLYWKFRFLFLAIPPRKPLLRGDKMCQWLHEAFETMDATSGGSASLMPGDRTLELFVPMTDFHGYERSFPIENPPFVRDRTHRHVMCFRHDGLSLKQFDRAYNHALAFAARATSSFPGAFDPISFAGYAQAVPCQDELGGRASEFFSMYALSGVRGSNAYFVDGGVLNNYPFGPAISAIQRKPAASEVERRLIYIEPDPRYTDAPPADEDAQTTAPSLIATALGAYAGIPGNQPIIDELMRLAERNAVVQRVQDVIVTSFQPVQERVTRLLNEHGIVLADVLSATSGSGVAKLTEIIKEAAVKDAGLGYATYHRLRIASLTDSYAALIADALSFPAGSYQAAFVAAVLREWAREAEDAQRGNGTGLALTAELDLLDLGYHERRLRFVIAALSWWYRADEPFEVPVRADLDAAKAYVYEAILGLQKIARDVALQKITTGVGMDAKVTPLLEVFRSKHIDEAFAQRVSAHDFYSRNKPALERLKTELVKRINDSERGLVAVEEAMYRKLHEVGANWSSEAKSRLLVRYLGFPYWDILVYPVQALANVGEQDHVTVARFSPRDATLLEPPDKKEGKLKGVKLAHFGAFLDRAYRENDYLWGRLDAAELLIDLLDSGGRIPADERVRLKVDALRAILAEERGTLPGMRELIRALEGQLDSRASGLSLEVVAAAKDTATT